MNTAAVHIAHLLAGTPSVSLAGLGTFERLVEPAVYNPETHTITPPRASVCFDYNPAVTTSAGLIRSVMATDCCGMEAAESELSQCAAMIEADLRYSGHFEFPGLGTLRGAPESAVLHQDSAFVDAMASCWLAPLALTPVFEESYALETPPPIDEEEAPAAPAEVQTPVSPGRTGIFWRNLRVASSWAAAILIFGVVALVTTLANRYGEDDGYIGANTLAANPAAGAHVLPAEPAQEAPLVLVFRTPADASSEARVRPEHTSGSSAAPQSEMLSMAPAAEPSGAYCLIVASLANRAEAEEFIAATASPCPLHLLETQGRFRVYATAGDNPAALLSQARESGLSDRFPNAWVCRR